MPLDARHRAMLLEMGVRVWAPPARAQPLAQALRTPAAAPEPEPEPSQAGASSPAPGGAPAGPWQVQAPQLLYPRADPALAPAALGAGWFIVAEAFAEGDPLAPSAERLLANMLAALRLHRHPRVALCSVGPASGAAAGEADAGAAIARHVAAFAPSVVLLMGRSAVRAALARSEPLGKLRGAALAIAGVPAVVTFGAYFLLRNPESKAAAWADLCRARALAGGDLAAPVP